jgi:hypothetical protein
MTFPRIVKICNTIYRHAFYHYIFLRQLFLTNFFCSHFFSLFFRPEILYCSFISMKKHAPLSKFDFVASGKYQNVVRSIYCIAAFADTKGTTKYTNVTNVIKNSKNIRRIIYAYIGINIIVLPVVTFVYYSTFIDIAIRVTCRFGNLEATGGTW